MARYQTTVTKKDGTKVSGYIENDRGYYDDGSAIGAGDSIVDKQGTVWTKPDTATTGAGGTGSGTGAGAGTGSGTGTPSAADLISQAIRDNNSGGGGSSSSSYRVTGVDKPNRTGYLRSAKELADLYDINYDMNAIRNLYDEATDAKYALLSKEREQAENDFYTNNANANATLLDTLKKATSSAIATGASRGLASAEQLGLMMEQQQAITDEATNLAQERANMADEIAVEKAENIIKALEYSDSMKQALAGISSNVYSADTQYDAALLEWAWQNRNIEALFEQIAAEKETNAAAQALQRELGLLEDQRIRDEGAADRALQDKMNQDTIAGNKEAAAITAAGYSNNQRTWYDDYIDAGNASSEAYRTGNVSLYIAAERQLTGESEEEIRERIDSDPNFPGSKAYKKRQEKIQKEQEKKQKELEKNQKEVVTSYSKSDGSRVIEYADGTTETISADRLKELSEIPTTLTYKR